MLNPDMQQGRVFQAIAIGQGNLPAALLLGASTTVEVVLSEPMMSEWYDVHLPKPNNMTLVVTAQTRTTVTVRVTAGLALPLGAPFYLLAVQ